jgi:hypothetical protein
LQRLLALLRRKEAQGGTRVSEGRQVRYNLRSIYSYQLIFQLLHAKQNQVEVKKILEKSFL